MTLTILASVLVFSCGHWCSAIPHCTCLHATLAKQNDFLWSNSKMHSKHSCHSCMVCNNSYVCTDTRHMKYSTMYTVKAMHKHSQCRQQQKRQISGSYQKFAHATDRTSSHRTRGSYSQTRTHNPGVSCDHTREDCISIHLDKLSIRDHARLQQAVPTWLGVQLLQASTYILHELSTDGGLYCKEEDAPDRGLQK